MARGKPLEKMSKPELLERIGKKLGKDDLLELARAVDAGNISKGWKWEDMSPPEVKASTEAPGRIPDPDAASATPSWP